MGVVTRVGTGAAAMATLVAVAGVASASPPDLVLETRAFLTGPGVIEPKADNYLYTPTAPQNGKLIVLFPGSSMDRYESFMTTAAAHGYHVLALDSPLTSKGKTTPAVRTPTATAICFGRPWTAT